MELSEIQLLKLNFNQEVEYLSKDITNHAHLYHTMLPTECTLLLFRTDSVKYVDIWHRNSHNSDFIWIPAFISDYLTQLTAAQIPYCLVIEIFFKYVLSFKFLLPKWPPPFCTISEIWLADTKFRQGKLCWICQLRKCTVDKG